MPTGYTMILTEEKEIDFKEFALRCARNFGALIMMRDEPMDKEIPEEFPVSDYHSKKLNECMEQLEQFKALSYKEYEIKAKEKFDKDFVVGFDSNLILRSETAIISVASKIIL